MFTKGDGDMVIRNTLQQMKEQGYTYEEIRLVLLDLMKESQEADELCEEMPYRVRREGEYTIEDYRKLPDDPRVELMDGRFYVMEAPSYLHQKIAGEIHRQIANFIVEQGGNCEPMIAPVDVQLDCDEKTMVQPDIAILCDRDKIRKWGVYGAPDFVLEILSPSSRRKDCTKKVAKYADAGVREYWIVDPYQKRLVIYRFDSEEIPMICGLEEPVPIGIYDGKLQIEFEKIREWMRE